MVIHPNMKMNVIYVTVSAGNLDTFFLSGQGKISWPMLKSLWRTGMKNTSDTDKSIFDELINSGIIENYKIIHDVHFFDHKSYYYW